MNTTQVTQKTTEPVGSTGLAMSVSAGHTHIYSHSTWSGQSRLDHTCGHAPASDKLPGEAASGGYSSGNKTLLGNPFAPITHYETAATATSLFHVGGDREPGCHSRAGNQPTTHEAHEAGSTVIYPAPSWPRLEINLPDRHYGDCGEDHFDNEMGPCAVEMNPVIVAPIDEGEPIKSKAPLPMTAPGHRLLHITSEIKGIIRGMIGQHRDENGKIIVGKMAFQQDYICVRELVDRAKLEGGDEEICG